MWDVCYRQVCVVCCHCHNPHKDNKHLNKSWGVVIKFCIVWLTQCPNFNVTDKLVYSGLCPPYCYATLRAWPHFYPSLFTREWFKSSASLWARGGIHVKNVQYCIKTFLHLCGEVEKEGWVSDVWRLAHRSTKYGECAANLLHASVGILNLKRFQLLGEKPPWPPDLVPQISVKNSRSSLAMCVQLHPNFFDLETP